MQLFSFLIKIKYLITQANNKAIIQMDIKNKLFHHFWLNKSIYFHLKADPLDVLSVAFPYPELEDEFQEDAETDEDVQVNVEEDMIEEGNKTGKEKGENENEQLEVL